MSCFRLVSGSIGLCQKVPLKWAQPATNRQYWADKIARNIERDTETTAYLQQAG